MIKEDVELDLIFAQIFFFDVNISLDMNVPDIFLLNNYSLRF